MWLSKIKAVIGTAWLYVVAVLAVLLALAGRRNASLRAEIAKREAARLQAVTNELQQRAERLRQATIKMQQERARVERDIDAGKRDYFEQDK
nr:MAG TPA: Protein of unknown function (DUF2570) [Caudoviricetes sp.]